VEHIKDYEGGTIMQCNTTLSQVRNLEKMGRRHLKLSPFADDILALDIEICQQKITRTTTAVSPRPESASPYIIALRL
jgi:hypothetical protein